MKLASKVTSKGQVTIPKEIRDSMGVGSAGKVCFTDLGNGLALLSVCDRPASDVFGFLKGRPRTRKGVMTVEEMDEAIARNRLEAGYGGKPS